MLGGCSVVDNLLLLLYCFLIEWLFLSQRVFLLAGSLVFFGLFSLFCHVIAVVLLKSFLGSVLIVIVVLVCCYCSFCCCCYFGVVLVWVLSLLTILGCKR